MTKTIDMKQFERQLSLYGADLSRWDDVDVKEVLAFIEKTPEAKTQFDEAMKLDAALALYDVPDMNAPQLQAMIASRVRQEQNIVTTLPFWQRGIVKSGAVFAACAVLLFAMVTMQNTAQQRPLDEKALDSVMVLAAADLQEEQELQELLELLEDSRAPAQNDKERNGADLDEQIDRILIKEIEALDNEDIWSTFMNG